MQFKAEAVRRTAILLTAAAAAVGLAQPALAADGWQAGDVVLRAGPAGVLFDSSGTISVAGAVVPGAGVQLSDNWSASGEVEYFLTPAISAAVNFGIPPTTRADATGTLAALGRAGSIHYGLGAVTARYNLNLGAVAPFAGVGVGHLFVFGETDGAVSNLKADSAWAPVFQGGVNVHLTDHVGIYGSALYAPLKTDARGTVMGGVPMTSRVTLNPTVVQGGMFFRF